LGAHGQPDNFAMSRMLKTEKDNRDADSIFEVEAIAQKESYGSMDRASDLHMIHHACEDAG
jgi:hypothetical protein